MNARELTHQAITITRDVLKSALQSPFTMAQMTMFEADPEQVENKVYDILEYLEKTKPKKAKEAES